MGQDDLRGITDKCELVQWMDKWVGYQERLHPSKCDHSGQAQTCPEQQPSRGEEEKMQKCKGDLEHPWKDNWGIILMTNKEWASSIYYIKCRAKGKDTWDCGNPPNLAGKVASASSPQCFKVESGGNFGELFIHPDKVRSHLCWLG